MNKVTIDRALIEQAVDAAFSPYCAQDLAILAPALRAALAEPAVKPYAWVVTGTGLFSIGPERPFDDDVWQPVFTSPPPPAEPDHWSDCATNSEPAYPAGACDCMPTPAMCRAAVEYVNGAHVYEKVPREALDIEESIYREVWIAMQAVAPPPAEPVPVPLLSDEEIDEIDADPSHETLMETYRAIEAAVRRKAGL